jgi:hypothetical protein
MQYVNGIIDLCHVDRPILAFMMNPNLADPAANSRHGLPIAGFQTKLNAFQLVAGFSSWSAWKGSQFLKR